MTEDYMKTQMKKDLFNRLTIFIPGLIVLVLFTFAVRGCWADNLKDYELTRKLTERCAIAGGKYSRVDGACYSVISVK